MTVDPVTTDIFGCSQCFGDHEDLVFTDVTPDDDETAYNIMQSTCPQMNLPVYLRLHPTVIPS